MGGSYLKNDGEPPMLGSQHEINRHHEAEESRGVSLESRLDAVSVHVRSDGGCVLGAGGVGL